jgi:hypothetical protein
VDLLEENAVAGQVYHATKRQVRVAPGSGEIIDLDYASVKAVMDVFGVADQRSVFEKVTRAFHHFIEERRKERST